MTMTINSDDLPQRDTAEPQAPARRSGSAALVFLVALVGGTFVAADLLPQLGNRPESLVPAPAWFAGGTTVWIAISGVLTGLGTKIGNGCTSGHGVCGLARLSTRSFVAVGVFFVVAIITVTLTGIV